jgi:hypothetical protein
MNSDNIINFTRFYDKELLLEKKQRTLFSKKACSELCSEAAKSIGAALSIHDEIESYYINAMDFNALTDKADEIIEKIAKENK